MPGGNGDGRTQDSAGDCQGIAEDVTSVGQPAVNSKTKLVDSNWAGIESVNTSLTQVNISD